MLTLLQYAQGQTIKQCFENWIKQTPLVPLELQLGTTLSFSRNDTFTTVSPVPSIAPSALDDAASSASYVAASTPYVVASSPYGAASAPNIAVSTPNGVVSTPNVVGPPLPPSPPPELPKLTPATWETLLQLQNQKLTKGFGLNGVQTLKAFTLDSGKTEDMATYLLWVIKQQALHNHLLFENLVPLCLDQETYNRVSLLFTLHF